MTTMTPAQKAEVDTIVKLARLKAERDALLALVREAAEVIPTTPRAAAMVKSARALLQTVEAK